MNIPLYELLGGQVRQKCQVYCCGYSYRIISIKFGAEMSQGSEATDRVTLRLQRKSINIFKQNGGSNRTAARHAKTKA